MSIREDAKNARTIRNILGYDPEDTIRVLRAEVARLKKRNKYLEDTLQCFNGSNK